jgi:glycosyltransferase involved in cell wall biosynthesis
MVETFIFSYRRGRFLENLLRSARETRWAGPITIIDDGSTDGKTLAALRRAERDGCTVVRREHGSNGKWGGLQASMAAALEIATGPVTLFAQDDLQFVRSLDDNEIERIAALVQDPRNSPFAFPTFHMQSWTASRTEQNYVFVDRLGMPVRAPSHPLTGYSEIALFSPERLRAANWDPMPRETRCSQIAERSFGPMISYPYPFLAFLPFPSVPRKDRRYAIKHPKRLPTPARLEIMRPDEVAALFARDPARIPFATEYLRPASRMRSLIIGRTHWEH